MKYKLIAFDMDGTLLDSRQRISDQTIEMIKRAQAAGKTVILSTGRSIPELQQFFPIIPELRYIICVSGALIYDVLQKEVLFREPMSAESVSRLLETARGEDIIVHFLGELSVIETDKIPRMDQYAMGQHMEMFDRIATKVDDIFEYFSTEPHPVEKINFFCPTDKKKKELYDKTRNLGLAIAFGEGNTIEYTAAKVNKGAGLERLCQYLSMDISETIAVGDSNNDLAILKTAGLSVAMGNAALEVKEAADVIVADNNHDGCAEAIEKYLL